MGIRINADEITRTLGSWDNMQLRFLAGKMAVSLLHETMRKGEALKQH